MDRRVGFSAVLVVLLVLAGAQVAQADTLTLAWDAVTGSDVAGYLLSWGTQSGVYTDQVDVGNQTAFSADGLSDGTTYYFVVQAYDVDGLTSDPSNEVSGQPNGCVPSVLTLAWDASPDSDVAGYLLSYGTQSGVYTQQMDVGGQLTYSMTDLSDSTTYFAVVQAYTSDSTLSDPSNEVNGQPTACQPPITSLNLTADTDAPQPTGTTITWTAAATGGVVPYEYKWWVFDGQNWSTLSDWTYDNTYAWTPWVSNPDYQIGVWVRSSGDSADAPELSSAVGFPIVDSDDSGAPGWN